MKSRKEAEAKLKKIIKDNATIQLLLKNIQWNEEEKLAWKFNLKVIAANQDKIGKTFSIKNRIKTPALFIRGERSNYILDPDIPEITKIFSHAEVKTIEGAGHWVHADKPEEFAACVKAFAL
jgi:pimeloyl-ACP methyl ester carboxylesterase